MRLLKLSLLIFLTISIDASAVSKSDFKRWGKETIERVDDYFSSNSENKCHFGLDFKNGTTELNFLTPPILEAGLRYRDIVSQIGDTPFLSPIASGIPVLTQLRTLDVDEGEIIEFKVIRGGKELTIPVTCPTSAPEYYNVVKDIGRALVKDKPLDCLKAIEKNSLILKQKYWFVGPSNICISRALAKKQITVRDYANRYYELMTASIDEALHKLQFVESKALGAKILAEQKSYTETASDWLAKNNFRYLANQLTSYWAYERQVYFEMKENSAPNKTPSKFYGKETLVSSGTGFMVNSEGYIATNHHVVEECTTVKLNDERLQVIAIDKNNDLAILKSSFKSNEFAYIAQSPPKLSDKVRVFGYPLINLLGKNLSATSGEVSSLSGFEGSFSQFTVSAPIQPGNSGGPIVNEQGEVIGVIFSTLDNVALAENRGITSQNVNFGIRSNLLVNILTANGITIPENRSNIKADYQRATKLLECYRT